MLLMVLLIMLKVQVFIKLDVNLKIRLISVVLLIVKCDYNTDKILYVYENFHALQKANPNIKRSTLLSACNGNKKSAYGYKWKYVPMDIPTGEYHEID